MRQRHGDQFLNGLLKPLQIVPKQLIGNRLGDLLAFVNIAAAMPESNGQKIFSGSVVAGQFAAFKELDEFLSQIGSPAGVCFRSSDMRATAPSYFPGSMIARPQPSLSPETLHLGPQFFQEYLMYLPCVPPVLG